MHKKSRWLSLCIFILTIFGLLSALAPVLDIDADGFWDSLVTEGFLLACILSASLVLLNLSTRSAPIQLTLPWLLSFLLILPPITTLYIFRCSSIFAVNGCLVPRLKQGLSGMRT